MGPHCAQSSLPNREAFRLWFSGEKDDNVVVAEFGAEVLEQFKLEKDLQGGATPPMGPTNMDIAEHDLSPEEVEAIARDLDSDRELDDLGAANLDVRTLAAWRSPRALL